MPGSRNRIRHSGHMIEIQIQVEILKEEDYFIARSPALDLSTYAKSAAKAKERFEDVLNIFIEDTTEKGTLERVLLDLGWKLQKKPTIKYQPPRERLSKSTHSVETLKRQVAIPV